MSGGKSIGKQREADQSRTRPRRRRPRSSSSRRAPAQQQAAPATPPAQQPSGMSRWLGPLAGLAIGAGLASLFFNNGLGGALMGILLVARARRRRGASCSGCSAARRPAQRAAALRRARTPHGGTEPVLRSPTPAPAGTRRSAAAPRRTRSRRRLQSAQPRLPAHRCSRTSTPSSSCGTRARTS